MEKSEGDEVFWSGKDMERMTIKVYSIEVAGSRYRVGMNIRWKVGMNKCVMDVF